MIWAIARLNTTLDTSVLRTVSVNQAYVLGPAQPTPAGAMCVRLEMIMVHLAGTNAVRILPKYAPQEYAPQEYAPPTVLKYVPPKYAPQEYVAQNFLGNKHVGVVVVPLKIVLISVVLSCVLAVGVLLHRVLVVEQTVEIAAEIDRSRFSLFVAYREYLRSI